MNVRHEDYRLRRDPENGWVLGVCAGLAEYFGLPVALVRILTMAGLVFFSVPTLVLYFALALFVPRRQSSLSADPDTRRFHQRLNRGTHEALDDIEADMTTIGTRLEQVERYLTSRRYRLNEEFRDLATGNKRGPSA